MSIGWMLLITVLVLQVSVLFTTIYLHRSLTHKGLRLHPVIANLMHLHLSLFTGIVPREWAAVHRKHHAYSDKPGDPHSPYIYGLWKVLFGNAFYYRREASNPATIRKFTRDYEPDFIDKLRIGGWGILGGLAIFLGLFGWAWGAALFIGQAVLYVLLNASINSICHMVGYRNFDNKATNLQSIALLTAGEGLHNNHHQFPSAPKLSVKPHEFDPAWIVIKLLVALRLAEVTMPLPMAQAA